MKIGKQFTNRESQSIDKYLQEIGKVEQLPKLEGKRMTIFLTPKSAKKK